MIDDLNYITMLGSRKNSSGGGVLFLINLQWELNEFDFLGKGDPDPRPSSVSEQDHKYRF